MYIEVTKETFFKLFAKDQAGETINNNGIASKTLYNNRELGQAGLSVFNFVAETRQYYLQDINA